jgi:hypothetical protein
MGALTEIEIFDCLVTNFRLAAEDADALAVLPFKGECYDRFRRELQLIEGACRQASAWREDTRWLPIGLMIAEVHTRAGDWLRGIKMPDGTRVKVANGQLHPLFVKLAENLRNLHAAAVRTRDAATGKRGAILPAMQKAPHRDTVPVGWTPSIVPQVPGRSLIVPPGSLMQ